MTLDSAALERRRSKLSGQTTMAELIGTSGTAPDWKRFGYGAAVSVLVVILLTEVVAYVRVQARLRKDLPPGPRPWPIIGNLPVLTVAMPHLNLQHLASKFGPLMYLRMGSVPYVIVSTAEGARELFQANDEHLSSRPRMLSVEILTEYKTMGFAPSTGKRWASLRRFSATELLSPKRVASYEGTRSEELSNMMRVLLETSDRGEALNLKHWLFQTAANMMTRMLMNKRLYNGNGADGYQEELRDEFDQWLHDRLDCILAPIIGDFVPWLGFVSSTLQGWRSKLEAFRDREVAFGLKLLELEKRRQRAPEEELDEIYVPDYVDIMLRTSMIDGKVLEDGFIVKHAMEFFIAGTETSSTTVEFALAELVSHPRLLKRAQEEIDEVVGLTRLVKEADIPKLPFLQAILKETFRTHPSPPFGLPRQSTAPVEAFGYKIPSKTTILYNLHAIHRDPAVYSNPDEFDPDRFLSRHAQVNHLAAFGSYELIPFGPGRRMCPGYNLGNTVVHLILANLIHSYDWSVPGGGRLDMTEVLRTSVVRLKEPLTLVPKLRDGVPAF